MDITAFWELMDKTQKASGGSPLEQSKLLIDLLKQLPEGDILDYYYILRDLMDQAYIADLWDAAHVIGRGCGDDGFMDFRAWLIGRGKETFERAIADPESLVNVVEDGQETQDGALLYVAFRAYELALAREMPAMPRNLPALKGNLREEHEKRARFPKLAAKFWKRR